MHTPVVAETKTDLPLCVDLDGTLIKTDLVWESLLRLLKQKPFCFFYIIGWWLRGRAYLKAQVAARVKLDVATLPYNGPFLDFLRAEKRRGRTIILATASDRLPAQQVADYVGVFDEVLASDGKTNLRARNKGAKLAEKFGDRGFDYAGNSTVDLPVWERAHQAVVVTGNQRLIQRAEERAPLGHTFRPDQGWLNSLFRALRPHHWVKNLILFVPLVMAHRLFETRALWETVQGFMAFCLCASAVYVFNDLLDLEVDRHHPTKRLRPFAAGDLSAPFGLAMIPFLLAASAIFASQLPWRFGAVLAVYAVLTTSYSWRVKEIALLDVFCLAALYTIRLIAGHEAAVVRYSFWLLAFSMFLFLSLALVKRFTELGGAVEELKGRGYAFGDRELVATLGTTSGYLAVLVLALYVNNPEPGLYVHPMRLLLICPLLLYWISRVWLLAHRGRMHEDPIVFALRDGTSYGIGALAMLVLWLATGR